MVSSTAVQRFPQKKSRFGCQTCKKRKIKCDEIRPTCTNCQKTGVPCHFTSIPPRPSQTSGLGSSPALEIQSPDGAISEHDRLLELRLMHHYSTQTSQDPFFATNDRDVIALHTDFVPVLALQYRPLLNAIFSVAALHLYKLDPSNLDYETAHRRYFEAALSSQRIGVESINAENAEAVCLTATAIANAALVTRSASQVYEPPSLWLDLTSKHHTLFKAAWDHIRGRNGRLVCVINAEPNLREYWHQLRQPYPDIFPRDVGSMFPDILGFEDAREAMDGDVRSIYLFILGYIAHCLQHIEAREEPSKSRRRLIALPAMAPSRFRDLVRERQSRALILLAYFFAVLKAVDDVWWLRGLPEREVFGVQSVLPERWQWAMAWPLQKLAYFGAAAVPSNQT